MKNIYFDHNATSPLHSHVKVAMSSVYELPLNPSSLHFYGRYARKILEESRLLIKYKLGLNHSHKLIFTSGCTEANNLIKNNFSAFKKICSCIEHPAVINVIGQGIIPVDNNGIVNLVFLEDYIANNDSKLLLSIMYANNEVGTIQPIAKIVKLVKKYNILLHCDITQAIGKIKINLDGIDLITFSSHKFGGPVGSGALIYNKNLELIPVFEGGGQEFNLRSGTQNMIAIYGMSTAFKYINEIIEKFSKTENLKIYLEKAIKHITNDAVIFGEDVNRLPNTSSISMPKVTAETQLMFFDLNGISVSAGSACSSGKINLPRIQLAMGYSEKVAKNALRISFGPGNTIDDVKKFVHLWESLYLRNK